MLENHLAVIPPEHAALDDFDSWKLRHPAKRYDNDFTAREYIRRQREFVYVCEMATGIPHTHISDALADALFDEACLMDCERLDEWIRVYVNAPENRWKYDEWLENDVMAAAYAAERRLYAAV